MASSVFTRTAQDIRRNRKTATRAGNSLTSWRVFWQDKIAWLNRHGDINNEEALRLHALLRQASKPRSKRKSVYGKRKRRYA